MIQGKLPPPGASLRLPMACAESRRSRLDHYVFLDANQKELVSLDRTTAYDPRVRPWYRAAEEAHAMIISDPDVFASEAVIGVTVAQPFYPPMASCSGLPRRISRWAASAPTLPSAR